jgi:hypothetical protein
MMSAPAKVMKAESEASPRSTPVGLTAACLLALLAALRLASFAKQLPSRSTLNDYSIYYVSAYLLRQGENPYTTNLTDPAARLGLVSRLPGATDPPTYLLMIEPLALLTPQSAYWTWQALNALALTVSLWMLLGRGLRADLAIALVASAVIYPAVINHFYYGQNKVQILLLLVLAMRFFESRRDAAAGVALALAALTRIFPLLLLGYLLIERRWRAMLFALATITGGMIVTGLAIGFGVEASFFKGFDTLTSTKVINYDTNVALGSFVSRLYWARFGVDPGARIEALRHLTIAAAALGVIALTCIATLRTASRRDPDSRIYSLWVATSILLSPTAWIHYMVMLFIPFARICSAANYRRASRFAITLAVTSYLLLLTGCPWGCTWYSGEFFSVVARHLGIGDALDLVIRQTATLSLMLGWTAAFVFAMNGSSEPEYTCAVAAGMDQQRSL